MVAIIGGFKAEFSGLAAKNLADLPRTGFFDPTLPMILPEKQRTPTSGRKLAGVLVCGRKDMSPDLAFSSAKWNPRKNRLPICPRMRFSVSGRYHVLPKSCHDHTRQAGEAVKSKNKNLASFSVLLRNGSVHQILDKRTRSYHAGCRTDEHRAASSTLGFSKQRVFRFGDEETAFA